MAAYYISQQKQCSFCFQQVPKGIIYNGKTFCDKRCKNFAQCAGKTPKTVTPHVAVVTPGNPVSVVYACRGCNATFYEASQPKVVINGHNYCGIGCYQAHPGTVVLMPQQSIGMANTALPQTIVMANGALVTQQAIVVANVVPFAVPGLPFI